MIAVQPSGLFRKAVWVCARSSARRRRSPAAVFFFLAACRSIRYNRLSYEDLQGSGDFVSCANGFLDIEVEDNGMGFFGKAGRRLYEQGNSTKSEDRGVGLYLVRRSAERLGGSVSYRSEIGRGTEFHIRIPYPGQKEEPE
ncbi:ATP-binding protein [Saccharibacillus deserti]|uniref:ATP-binding protein n=1 Tax=Saccharibacillus deserti TaxID=1634444 RepID=UPI001555540C|nr:ATP-binding protein [Saccharibacillus deserti]